MYVSLADTCCLKGANLHLNSCAFLHAGDINNSCDASARIESRMQPLDLEAAGAAPGEARLHIPASGYEASLLAANNGSAGAENKADVWRESDDRPRGIRVTCQARADGAITESLPDQTGLVRGGWVGFTIKQLTVVKL